MITRQEYEKREQENLAPYAMKSSETVGREFSEEEHLYRTAFQRDRDRVIHSNAFRRLEYKTQVFVYHEGDHYRTRLTHSLEGAQIARTLARILRLNEDLAEAIILAHDLGHTPFGHSGEEVMNRLMKDHGGYEHNRQSLRIVTTLEDRYPNFPGLNLTYEVREGLAKHKSEYDTPEIKNLHKKGNPTLEAQIVNLADEIAYCNHDLDDGLRSRLITLQQLKEVELWQGHYDKISPSIKSSAPEKVILRQTVRSIIDTYVTDLARETEKNLTLLKIKSIDEVRATSEKIVCLSETLDGKNKQLKRFLYTNMYKHPHVQRMAEQAERVIESLFNSYLNNPKNLPLEVQQKFKMEIPEKVICDYIAGMTDRFALNEHQRLKSLL
ncbi:MAG: deoxyguanosinetriphosphate triphosphohydrolase [Deltaproteobacteria bacterium]|nr:deoxyguanosinetriphosphate triphosphohydrolase [Deltaproteobacteria bacterium]